MTTIFSMRPNQAHEVDAAITRLFHIARPSRRATDVQFSPAFLKELEPVQLGMDKL
jgi:hypothetical protein